VEVSGQDQADKLGELASSPFQTFLIHVKSITISDMDPQSNGAANCMHPDIAHRPWGQEALSLIIPMSGLTLLRVRSPGPWPMDSFRFRERLACLDDLDIDAAFSNDSSLFDVLSACTSLAAFRINSFPRQQGKKTQKILTKVALPSLIQITIGGESAGEFLEQMIGRTSFPTLESVFMYDVQRVDVKHLVALLKATSDTLKSLRVSFMRTGKQGDGAIGNSVQLCSIFTKSLSHSAGTFAHSGCLRTMTILSRVDLGICDPEAFDDVLSILRQLQPFHLREFWVRFSPPGPKKVTEFPWHQMDQVCHTLPNLVIFRLAFANETLNRHLPSFFRRGILEERRPLDLMEGFKRGSFDEGLFQKYGYSDKVIFW